MLRKLSPIERLACKLGEDEPICFAIPVRFRGKISVELLENALAKARQRHPLVAARVVDGPGGVPWFGSTEARDVPLEVLDETTGEEWISVTAKELERLTNPETDPFVRFVWIRGPEFSHLVILCHHAISDGLSTHYLLSDVMRFLDEPAAAVEPLPLMPPVEDLVPEALEAELRADVRQELARTSLRDLLADEEMSQAIESATPSIRVLTETWDAERASLLVRRTRERRTTVQGAVGAAFLSSFSEHFGGKTGYVRNMHCPVNIRPMLRQPVGEAFGLFANQVEASADCAPGRDYWEIARDIRASIKDKSTPRSLLRSFVAMKQIVAFGLDFDTIYKLGRPMLFGGNGFDLTLSNVGRLTYPTVVGPLEFVSLFPSNSAIGNEARIFVGIVNGTLTVTFVHDQNGIEADVADSVLARALDHLRAASK
jgi:hypothetical protein